RWAAGSSRAWDVGTRTRDFSSSPSPAPSPCSASCPSAARRTCPVRGTRRRSPRRCGWGSVSCVSCAGCRGSGFVLHGLARGLPGGILLGVGLVDRLLDHLIEVLGGVFRRVHPKGVDVLSVALH